MLIDRNTLREWVLQEREGIEGPENCNTPVVELGPDTFESVEGQSRMVPGWTIFFSCPDKTTPSAGLRVKFRLTTPPEKSELQIRQEIKALLLEQLK